mgnify:CR=1 FL=1
MVRLKKIFFGVWLIAVLSNNSAAQDMNEDIFTQNFRQATDLIEETGDSLRLLIAGINESADLTDLQKAKIDLVHLKLNTLEDVLKAMSSSEQIPDTTNRFPGTYIDEAIKLIVQSRPDEGIPLLLKFLEDVNNQSDSAIYAKIYLAEAYRQKQEYNKGISMIYEVLSRAHTSTQNKAFAMNRLAALYNEMPDINGSNQDSVAKYSRLCIDVAEKNKLYDYLAASQNELGSIYLKRGMPDSALILISEASSNFLLLHKYPQAINTYINLSHVYSSMGELEASKDILIKALDLGSIEENRNLFMYVYYHLAEKSFIMGDYQSSYTYLHVAYTLLNQFFNDRIHRQINEMTAKYDLREKETKINEEAQKNRVYRLQLKYLGAISLIIISLLIILVVMSRLKNRAYKKLVEQNLKAIKMEKQVEQCLRNLTETDIMNRVGATDRHTELALRLDKFMAEEKPYLWSDVGLEEFCKKLNTNRTYLSNLINDRFNMGFYDFLFEYRVKSALEYLSNEQFSHLSVEGIGEMTGFKSSSTFYKRFKNAVGMTPHQFRERVQKLKKPPLE